LARALYFDADIYLLDDPISAVDSKVAKKIYENVIMKMKGNKTIILVTHQISYMYGCDRVIIMEDGRVTDFDEPAKLKNRLNVNVIARKTVNRQLKKSEKSFQNM
jgi:ATP-binding cassette subfamily C (CFTR/MRP) protein 4